MSFMKPLDGVSPLLRNADANGTHFDVAFVDVTKSTGSPVWKLDDVVLTSYRRGMGDSNGQVLDQFSLNFTAMTLIGSDSIEASLAGLNGDPRLTAHAVMMFRQAIDWLGP
jgi:type VI protein secretion system component Hcp